MTPATYCINRQYTVLFHDAMRIEDENMAIQGKPGPVIRRGSQLVSLSRLRSAKQVLRWSSVSMHWSPSCAACISAAEIRLSNQVLDAGLWSSSLSQRYLWGGPML